jgi:type IV pilus modification protein PilV
MKTHSRSTRPSGFSLLEVLVAVVILSFGLLALSALQGSLFKNSSEAKAQSAGLALAQEKLEYLRGFQDMATYLAIDTSAAAESIPEGGVTYSRTWTVDRCALKTATSVFDCDVANTGALDSKTYTQNNEFKKITVNVTWSDAQGVGQRVSLEEAVAALDPSDSAKIGKLTTGTLPRGPQVRIYDPSKQQQGVIPIAISEGTDTAATNPKPLVNGSSAIETRFDVLTYTDATDDGTALAQARTETSLVGCSCNTATAATSGAKRPSYWDGTRYTEPEDATAVIGASYVPPAGADSSATTQSALCTICCRDHHDPSSLPAGAAKFDPRRSTHSHYLLNSTTGALTGPVTSGKYTEACRVIRVNGLFRVAADMYDDYQNFLATKNDNSTTGYLPTTTATTNYQNFVKAYLDLRIVNQASQSNWNDVLPISNGAAVTNLETTNSIYYTQPDAIDFQASDTAKWLHLRGLYIDYLEDKARQAIADAKSTCTAADGSAPSTSDLESCVLKVLPFTSINLTELGKYTPKEGDQIVVANNNFLDTLSSSAPVRGKVTRGTSPTANQVTNALGILRRSNSGLTTLIGGIDSDDATADADSDGIGDTPATWTATQPYKIVGSGSSGGSTGGTFYGNFYVGSSTTAYPFTANVLTPFINSSLSGVTCNPATAGNTYTCTSSSALGVGQTLTVGNYNYQTVGTSSDALSCFDGTTTTALPDAQKPYATKVCRNYAVTSVTLNGAVISPTLTQNGTDGSKAETTTISSPLINNTDVVGIIFGSPVDTPQPSTCSVSTVTQCKGKSGNCTTTTTYSVTAEDCP